EVPAKPSDAVPARVPARTGQQPAPEQTEEEPAAEEQTERLTGDYAPALDMTAEIPRVRLDWEQVAAPAAVAELSTGNGDSGESHRRVPDETMELPIYRALESAWFRTHKPVPGMESAIPRGNGKGMAEPAPEPAAVW